MEGLIINTNSEVIEQRQKMGQTSDMQGQKMQFDEKNYLNTRLKPGEKERKIKVRILPVSATNGDIFLPIKIHSMKVRNEISNSGFKTFVCLNDANIKEHDGRGCPLCNKSKEWFEDANNTLDEAQKKEKIKMGYSFQSKIAYVVRVIERGKENEGVKFWRFNHRTDHLGIYDKLMTLYEQRRDEAAENGQNGYSIFDLMNGRDIEITLKYVESTKKTSIDIIDSGFQTPLSRDIAQANAWIQDSKTWKDIYALKSYEYLDIVGEGEIPDYDTETKTWVVKQDNSEYNGNDTQHQVNQSQYVAPQEVQQPVIENSVTASDDLPF